MVFTMPTNRHPFAGDAVERFEYEVRSKVHFAAEQYPLTMFIGHDPEKQVYDHTVDEVQYRSLEGFGDLTGEERGEEMLRIAREMGASA